MYLNKEGEKHEFIIEPFPVHELKNSTTESKCTTIMFSVINLLIIPNHVSLFSTLKVVQYCQSQGRLVTACNTERCPGITSNPAEVDAEFAQEILGLHNLIRYYIIIIVIQVTTMIPTLNTIGINDNNQFIFTGPPRFMASVQRICESSLGTLNWNNWRESQRMTSAWRQ